MNNLSENPVKILETVLIPIAIKIPFSEKYNKENKEKISLCLTVFKKKIKSFLKTSTSPNQQLLIKRILIRTNLSPLTLLHIVKLCEMCKPWVCWNWLKSSNERKIWEVIRDLALRLYFQKIKEMKRVILISKLRSVIGHLDTYLNHQELFNLCAAFDKKNKNEIYLRDPFIKNHSFKLNHQQYDFLWKSNKYFPSLKKLALGMGDIHNITTIIKVPENLVFKDLKSLTLVENARYVPFYTDTFFQLTPFISSLTLISYLNPLLRLNRMGHLYEKMEKLELFSIQPDFFCKCKEVNVLNLFKNLNSLSLNNISTIDEEQIELFNLTHLEVLTLCDLSNPTLNTLSTLLLKQNLNLTSLTLIGRKKQISHLDSLTLASLQIAHSHLKTLELAKIEIDDNTLSQMLLEAKDISYLYLGEGVDISTQTMKSLKTLKELKTLKIEHSQTINKEALSDIIKNNIHLQTLVLSNCPLAILNETDYEKIKYSGLKNFITTHISFFNNLTFSKFTQCFQEIEHLDFPKQLELDAGHLFQSVRLMAHIRYITLFTTEKVNNTTARLPGKQSKTLHKISINNNISYETIEWYFRRHIKVLTH